MRKSIISFPPLAWKILIALFLIIASSEAFAAQITIATNPVGLQVLADGVYYTSPYTFDWDAGSVHTISVDSPQDGPPGTRYVFSSWSDGGAQAHTITVGSGSETYIANFTTQYSLTTSVSPAEGGSVYPAGTNWYDSGQDVSIWAIAGVEYTFSGWSGDLTGSANPASLMMDSPKSVIAPFAAIPEVIATPSVPSGRVSGQVGNSYSFSTGGSSSNLGHVVEYRFDWGDGTFSSWSSSSAASKAWSSGGIYAVRAQARCATHPEIVSEWSSTLSVAIFAVTAQIKLAWDLPTTNEDGTSLDDLAGYRIRYGIIASGTYQGSIDVGNVTTYTLDGLGKGLTYYITVTAYDTSNNESGYSNEVVGAIVTVSTDPPGLQVVVDSAPPAVAPQTFGWEVGSSHSLLAPSPQAEAGGSRSIFSSWNDGEAQGHTITVPSSGGTYTANFRTQYSLATAVNPAGGGTVSPSGANWYESGQSVTLSATASSDYSFSGWAGDLAGSANPASLIMNGPKSVTAQFTAIPETITVPNTPDGPTSGTTGSSYTFSTGGSVSNLGQGHSPEYRFDWGDGTYSGWSSSTTASKTWSSGGSYAVKAQARCKLHPEVMSGWSSALSVAITLPYTVTTSPSGRQVVVDGSPYTAAYTFNWTPGSAHTLAVLSPEDGSSGTRYVFSSWSDGGAQSHTVTVPSASTTYTANFTTQYSLITAVNPTGGGTVSPSGTNWYNSGDSVPVSAIATSGYAFIGWSGDLSGATNPTPLFVNGPKSITVNFEVVATPNAPSGPTSGTNGTSYTYIASGASSNLGHPLEFQFDWRGDGTDLSLWGAANQQKTWIVGGHYSVRVRARCALHTSVISNWSPGTPVEIRGDFQISCTDGGIPCIERPDGGNDSDNLVNGKPKVDVEYEFRVVVKDAGGLPQYVKLFMTQRNDPFEEDFYEYDMSCKGDYQTGANCTYRTKLGPAAIHKFYFKAKMSNGMTLTYPTSGYVTGPKIQLLRGYNLVGIPRDINNAQIDGQQALGSSEVYRWDSSSEYYTEVTTLEPVMAGEGFLLYAQNPTLIELASYEDVPGLEYAYLLHSGMNLISNPYAGNVRLSDVKIQKGNQAPVSWHEAVINGWILNALYYYNGKDWGDTYSYMTDEDGAALVPWLGYWVSLESTDDVYYLVIPRP